MRDIIFPSTVGVLVRALRARLTDVTVQPKLPRVHTARMVTVADNSGPDDGTQSRRRVGVNVWAASPTDAENLALLCMAILRSAPDGNPITNTDQFSGPAEVFDQATDLLMVGDSTLSHYFFTLRISVRGSDF